MRFYGEELFSTSPNPQAGGTPVVGCPRLNIFTATLHIGGRSFIRNLRRAIPWWQGLL